MGVAVIPVAAVEGLDEGVGIWVEVIVGAGVEVLDSVDEVASGSVEAGSSPPHAIARTIKAIITPESVQAFFISSFLIIGERP